MCLDWYYRIPMKLGAIVKTVVSYCSPGLSYSPLNTISRLTLDWMLVYWSVVCQSIFLITIILFRWYQRPGDPSTWLRQQKRRAFKYLSVHASALCQLLLTILRHTLASRALLIRYLKITCCVFPFFKPLHSIIPTLSYLYS